jgi:hypothetical protein
MTNSDGRVGKVNVPPTSGEQRWVGPKPKGPGGTFEARYPTDEEIDAAAASIMNGDVHPGDGLPFIAPDEMVIKREATGDLTCPWCLTQQVKLVPAWLEVQDPSFAYRCENDRCGETMLVDVFFTPTFRTKKSG